MQISVVPMNEESFVSFERDSTESFAHELSKVRQLSESAALDEARQSFAKLFSEGLKSNKTKCFDINGDGKRIGYVAFRFNELGQKKIAFVLDLKIFEEFKGQGIYAMPEIKRLLKAEGCSKITLHVFASNTYAKKLYDMIGFQVDSYNMSLAL